MEEMKTCKYCGEIKPITEFRLHKGKYRSHKCKKCEYKKAMEYQTNHRDKCREYARKHYITHHLGEGGKIKKRNTPEQNKIKYNRWKTRSDNDAQIILKEETCEILKIHRDILADDPEHLPTEFIKKLISKEDICPDVKG